EESDGSVAAEVGSKLEIGSGENSRALALQRGVCAANLVENRRKLVRGTAKHDLLSRSGRERGARAFAGVPLCGEMLAMLRLETPLILVPDRIIATGRLVDQHQVPTYREPAAGTKGTEGEIEIVVMKVIENRGVETRSGGD